MAFQSFGAAPVCASFSRAVRPPVRSRLCPRSTSLAGARLLCKRKGHRLRFVGYFSEHRLPWTRVAQVYPGGCLCRARLVLPRWRSKESRTFDSPPKFAGFGFSPLPVCGFPCLPAFPRHGMLGAACSCVQLWPPVQPIALGLEDAPLQSRASLRAGTRAWSVFCCGVPLVCRLTLLLSALSVQG